MSTAYVRTRSAADQSVTLVSDTETDTIRDNAGRISQGDLALKTMDELGELVRGDSDNL